MKLHELTMPLDWEWMPDELFPTAVHFLLPPRRHPAKGLTMSTETGTCLVLPSQFDDFRKTIRLHDIAADRLFLRETVVVTIPRDEGEEIDEEAVEAALRNVELRPGDALLIRTGWGDHAGEARGTDRYVLQTPHLTPQGAERLGRIMADHTCDLLLLDTAVVGLPSTYLIPQWARMMPRPHPWPSEAAHVYLRTYTPHRAKVDFAADYALAQAGVMIVKKLVNCGAIGASRIRINVAPLHLVRGIGATCRVVAIEE